MSRSILAQVDTLVLCIVLFFLMLFFVWLGNRLRKKFWSAEEGDTKGGVNSLLGALFGLWAFLLAFTFGQTGTRFETIRSMIVDEANILRTTILRADLFPDSIRDAYRVDLRKYLEERISYYEDADNVERFRKTRGELTVTASSLWRRSVEQSKRSDIHPVISGGMVASLTSLFDIGIRREALLNSGVPPPIQYTLIALALSICLVGGFTTPAIKKKEWIVVAVFALLAVSIIYITIDLSRPMSGLIRPDAGQATIINLRNLF